MCTVHTKNTEVYEHGMAYGYKFFLFLSFFLFALTTSYLLTVGLESYYCIWSHSLTHTHTHTHTVGFPGRGIGPLHRPRHDNKQHTQQTDIHAPRQDSNPQSQRVSAADVCLRWRGQLQYVEINFMSTFWEFFRKQVHTKHGHDTSSILIFTQATIRE